jgi:hypothetical protein
MTEHKIEHTDIIKIRDNIKLTFEKVDVFLNKLIDLFLKIVPTWFRIMEWLVVSGAILYVYIKYNLLFFGILFAVSFFLLVFYITFPLKRFLDRITRKHQVLNDLVSFAFIFIFLIIYSSLLYAILGFSLPK